MKQAENVFEHSELPQSADDIETNIYSFGIFMLEIISGRLPHSKEQGDILKWVSIFSMFHQYMLIFQVFDRKPRNILYGLGACAKNVLQFS